MFVITRVMVAVVCSSSNMTILKAVKKCSQTVSVGFGCFFFSGKSWSNSSGSVCNLQKEKM